MFLLLFLKRSTLVEGTNNAWGFLLHSDRNDEIERSKSSVAVSTWLPQTPKINVGSMVHPRQGGCAFDVPSYAGEV